MNSASDSRSILLLGEEGLRRLHAAHVAVIGLGGVGGGVVEALARASVGRLTLVDGDTFAPSNLNRQLGALLSTLDRPKAEVWAERVADINPDCRVTAHAAYLNQETMEQLELANADYIVDAIDQVTAKLLLVEFCQARDIPLLSCMGTGNRLDPAQFQIMDIYSTSGCGLARVMRRELRKRGIPSLRVLASREAPMEPLHMGEEDNGRVPGSVSFVPPVAGFILAGEVIRELTGVKHA